MIRFSILAVAPLSFLIACLSLVFGGPRIAMADGKVIPPRDYKGSLEERAQEAVIIFQGSDRKGGASEDLILKIHVEGDAKKFAWVIPFPNEPKIGKEDPRIFKELFDYVQSRKYSDRGSKSKNEGRAPAAGLDHAPVKVIARKIVGDFDITIVQEQGKGGLNPWLNKNGYQELENADDVLEFYRKKRYVYACIKVTSEALGSEREIESHPLRFSFKTGGRDGIYFPMKLTGLQSKPFDVNLYVFYRFWINDKLSRFGFRHRGFHLEHRDWDSPQCEADGGKAYSLPEEDPFLKNYARKLPTVTKLFQKLHPGEKYYLTNIQAQGLDPSDVRAWSDDLWLFPYYTNRNMVPYDARSGGAAADAYPNTEAAAASGSGNAYRTRNNITIAATVAGASVLAILGWLFLRHCRRVGARRRFENLEYSEPRKA